MASEMDWYRRFVSVTRHLRLQGHTCTFILIGTTLRAPGVVLGLPVFRPANQGA